ncbi:hypothetical protein IWQ54_003500 [Labrenzia sp. EL_195]|nr:hypothetical protein [Labrenzia sp. EL_195]
MAERTKKQHLVAHFYLKRFCDSNGNVWSYSPDMEPFARIPSETAVQSNFYSPIVEGERYDDLETLLANIESNAAPLWRELLSGAVFEGEKREKVALFLAAQYLRSPSAVRAGAELAALVQHKTSSIIASHKEMNDKLLDEFEAEKGLQLSTEEREKLRQFVLGAENYQLDVLQSAGLPILGGMGNLANIFSQMKWLVGKSKNQHLITSDNPVVRVCDPATIHPIYGEGGFANKTVRVTFPLSPTHMLEMNWAGRNHNKPVEIPKSLAREFNVARAVNAEKYVFANQRDGGIKNLCDKRITKEKNPIAVSGPDDPKINIKRKL